MATEGHGAAPSALGYLYQCEVALLGLLDRLWSGEQVSVSLEVFDDVAFEFGTGTDREILELKHHPLTQRDLIDTSRDLWRTLAIWTAAWVAAEPGSPVRNGGSSESSNGKYGAPFCASVRASRDGWTQLRSARPARVAARTRRALPSTPRQATIRRVRVTNTGSRECSFS